MKHILTLLSFLLILSTAHAQAPQGIPYQAAARNSSGAVIASTSISVRFTIRDSVTTGIIKYRETHSTTTDANGMFSLTVGQGTPISGTFASINWGTNAKFLQVELDPAGGSSYIDMGTQQMMSVPYALSSATASSVSLTVSVTGDTLYSGGGKYVIIPGISAANCTVTAGTITGIASLCFGSTTTLSNTTSGGVWSSSATGVATVGSTGIVSGLSSGTATISYTVTNTCGTATATYIVTVNPLTLAGTITGTSTICVGSSTTLSNTTSGGTWSSSAAGIATIGSTGIVSGVSSGTTTISYAVTNSCGTSITTYVVTVNPLPPAGTITGTATVPSGCTTTLSNATTGGTWSSSSTGIASVGTGGIVSGVAEGTATISYTVAGTCGSGVATRVVTVGVPSLCIGSSYGGGVVGYILLPTDPGYVAGQTRGIIAAPSDQSSGIKWGCYGTDVSGLSSLIGTGAANTAIISSACGTGTAASLCSDLVLGGYSDWYLPSINELYKICANKAAIGGFAASRYWSSSQFFVDPSTTGLAIYTASCGGSGFTKNALQAVRAVRSFVCPETGTITGTATVTAGSTTTLSNTITGGTWSSSATGIATVGSTGVVTGVAAGTATISYSVTSACGSAVATQVVTVNAVSLTIGTSYGGGIIAYILMPGDPGYVAGETHGLIAAPSDQSTGIQWRNGSYLSTGATGTALGTGMSNTNTIVTAQGSGSYAAKLCSDLVLGGYSDWYLPSFDELNKIWINKLSIGGFSTGNYWSSSEFDAVFARHINFTSGGTANGDKNNSNNIRAVRAF